MESVPRHIVPSLIKLFNQKAANDIDNNTTEMNDARQTLWLETPYIGTKREQLLLALKKKLLHCLNITKL